ncbi:MAG: T9SS type A sorting domain-containing protein [Chitinophagaceae bacterium]|nr:T9SS type A sorting domain-containing protein [Chitinophagaceae bacterium]
MNIPKTIILIFFPLLIVRSISVQAQNPQIIFQKNYGGSGNDVLYQYYTYTQDGNIVFWANTQSNDGDISKRVGTTDMWALNINSNGSTNWDKCYGTVMSSMPKGICLAKDGLYLSGNIDTTGGSVSSCHGKYDYWCAKTDHTGNIVWEKSFGGSEIDYLYNSISTSDGGVLLIGTTVSNDGDVTGYLGLSGIWLVKLNENGGIVWENYIGNKDYTTSAVDGIEKSNGGFVLVGVDGHPFDFKYTIMNLDANGNLVYSKRYGGSDLDEPRRIRQTKDGGYIIVGYTKSIDGDVKNNHGKSDVWIVKTKSNLDLEWTKTYGGSDADAGSDIIECMEGGYIIAGGTGSIDGDVKGIHISPFTQKGDAWVVKIDDTGTIEWQTCLGGTAGDGASGIIQASDSNYYVLGGTTSNDGDLTGNNGGIDLWYVKLSHHPTTINNILDKNTNVSVYPNPAQNKINFQLPNNDYNKCRLTIYNIIGTKVANFDFVSEYSWDVSCVPTATYHYEIQADNILIDRGKVVVQH